MIPFPLDSDRHLAPGRELAGVAAARLVFRQRTEISTAVREVSPLLQPIVNRDDDTGVLRVIVSLCPVKTAPFSRPRPAKHYPQASAEYDSRSSSG